jgi:hypothetical protein
MSFRKLLAIAKDVSWRAAAGFSDRVPYPSVCPECKYWSLEHFPEGSVAFPDIKFQAWRADLDQLNSEYSAGPGLLSLC